MPHAHLVKIFASEEGLVVVLLQQSREGGGLLALLPGLATTVALQSVIDHVVVVGVLPCQDAGTTRTAQWTRYKLGGREGAERCD